MIQQKISQAIEAMRKQDFKTLNSLLIELDNNNTLRENTPGLPKLELGGIKSSATLYHGITPRSSTFMGDEMPNPSEMITPVEYVSIINSIQNNGLKGFHSNKHPLYLNDDFPTIYFSSTIAGTHGHLGVYLKKPKEFDLFTINSENQMVLFAEQFKTKFGVYVKTFDYITSNYDGGRTSFESLTEKEKSILENHVEETIHQLNKNKIDYQILDLGENNSLIEPFEYEEKQFE